MSLELDSRECCFQVLLLSVVTLNIKKASKISVESKRTIQFNNIVVSFYLDENQEYLKCKISYICNILTAVNLACYHVQRSTKDLRTAYSVNLHPKKCI